MPTKKPPAKKQKPSQPEQSLTPYLLYNGVPAALRWLAKAFGFVEFGDRYKGPDGTVQHAAMQLQPKGEVFMLGCPGPQFKNPKALGTATQMMYINVENVDKHFQRA